MDELDYTTSKTIPVVVNNGITEATLAQFLHQLEPMELLALGEPPRIRIETRHFGKSWNNDLFSALRDSEPQQISVLVIESDSTAHCYALLLLEKSYCRAAAAAGCKHLCFVGNAEGLDLCYRCYIIADLEESDVNEPSWLPEEKPGWPLEMSQLSTGMSALKAIADRQSETAARQAQNIERLVAVTERQQLVIKQLLEQRRLPE